MKKCFWLSLFLLLLGCAEKSEITPLFEAIPLRESHGDGEFAVFTVKLPLSDQSIESYNSIIDPNTGVSRVPLLGDVLRLMGQSVFNLGAELGMGKTYLTIKQPIPDLDSPYIKSISVKRVFFHIDQKDLLGGIRQRSFLERARSIIRGGATLDFSFLRELKIHMRMEKDDKPITSYVPELLEGDRFTLTRDENTIEFLSYKRKRRILSLVNGDSGATFIIYSNHPVQVRSFIRRDPELSKIVKEMTIINKTLMIELHKSNFNTEQFFTLLERNESQLERLGIKKIDPCNDRICMDVKVNNQNLLPLLLKGNQLHIQTFIDASKVPPRSFQLKGFIEFEVKLDVPL
jgi:hypothetical protein